jgi:hypothetical protein
MTATKIFYRDLNRENIVTRRMYVRWLGHPKPRRRQVALCDRTADKYEKYKCSLPLNTKPIKVTSSPLHR